MMQKIMCLASYKQVEVLLILAIYKSGTKKSISSMFVACGVIPFTKRRVKRAN